LWECHRHGKSRHNKGSNKTGGIGYYRFLGALLKPSHRFFNHREIANAGQSAACKGTEVVPSITICNNSALKLGGHVMFIDTKFNSLLTVFQNLYQHFSTTAMKLHHYIRAMGVRPSEKFIKGKQLDKRILTSGVIEQVIVLQFTLTRSHLKAWRGSACAVTNTHIRWYVLPSAALTSRLGAKAFLTVLAAKQTGYNETINWLKEMMKGNHCGRLQRSVERIASRHNRTNRIKY